MRTLHAQGEKDINEAQREDFPLVEAAGSQSAFESTAISIFMLQPAKVFWSREKNPSPSPTIMRANEFRSVIGRKLVVVF